MKEQKYHIYLTNQERSEIIESLIDFKNIRMQQGKYTDAVDEVLVKVIRAKKKKARFSRHFLYYIILFAFSQSLAAVF